MHETVKDLKKHHAGAVGRSQVRDGVVSENRAMRSSSDYDRIAEAIEYLADHVERQPSLDDVARHLHMSPFHFQRIFSRWAGVTPKRFLQVLTVERAKGLLDKARPLLEVTTAVGLSSGSRLHDHFVSLEAMTPGEFKSGGVALRIDYGVHETPFGPALLAATQRGVCSFTFVDDSDDVAALAGLLAQWPNAQFHRQRARTGEIVRTMFESPKIATQPLSLHVTGTNFQVNVWRALVQLAPTELTSYSRVAKAVGRPSAARAVGQAVGANPVALLIPCHRVIQETGQIGGYHWGVQRKLAIHAWEAARTS